MSAAVNFGHGGDALTNPDSWTPCHLDKVILHHCQLEVSMRYATDVRNQVDALIVELGSGSWTGWGEVFLPRVDPLWTWARRVGPMLLGKNAADLDLLLADWPADRPKMSLAECGTYCHPEVDCVAEAVSIALHDLVARRHNRRFADILGKIMRTEIPGMPVVTLDEPTLMAQEAADWVACGVKFLKVKLCGTAVIDVAIIRAVRAAVGPAVTLQMDANGAYPTADSAKLVVDALNIARVDVIEDLIEIDREAELRVVRAQLNGRTMLDKESYWPRVETILQRGLADVVNQHPHNQGSMSNALRIAAAAHTAGIANAIGSSGIFGIQNTAFLHLAAITGLSHPCEDIGFHNYHDVPVHSAIRFGTRPTVLRNPVAMVNGMLNLPTEPGLGVTVDRDALQRFTQEKIVLT